MKFTVAAATAMTLAIVAATASAGVIVTQDMSRNDQRGERKTVRIVMVQGHKQKVIKGDQETITDLDAGRIILVRPSTKKYFQGDFPPTSILAASVTQEGLSVGFAKVAKSGKVAGYACQGYLGSASFAHTAVSIAECVAKDAPGAKEFTEFRRLEAQKLKGTPLAPTGEVPDGIPVSSITTLKGIAFSLTGGVSPELLAKIQADNDKHAIVTGMNVSKIEVKDIPAETFVVPADYGRTALPELKVKQGPAPRITAPARAAPH